MRPVTLYSLLRRTGESRTTRWRPECISLYIALQCIRRGRRSTATVSVYETTDREGTALHVAHVHYGPERFDGADFVTDIYEIPTAVLTDL
ncbi:hypothetical protein OG592_21005 [Streptomyces avidinii]|uniref:hypothetical protein n=1 Tax=Streptomyces avidinii TaxID=1895 RepID=UPI00386D2B16|nr:hypothetical protein OG592_21005 [Streptomyces avidinii]